MGVGNSFPKRDFAAEGRRENNFARLSLLPPAQEHVLSQSEGKERFLLAVSELSSAFALSVPHAETIRIRRSPFRIGRVDSDLVIPLDSQLSASHAEILLKEVNGKLLWHLKDLGPDVSLRRSPRCPTAA